MCAPVMAAAAVASTVASLYAQQQQMNATASYQNKMADANAKQMSENAKLATQAYVEQTKQLQIRNMQENEASLQKIIQNDISAEKARGTAQAAAGDAGVTGLSVGALMADFHRQQNNYDTTVKTNSAWANQQLTEDMKQAQASAQGRINSVQPYIAPPIKTPDYLGTVLGGAKDVYSIGSKAEWWK